MGRIHRAPLLVLLLAVLASLTLVAACSSDDNGDSADGTDSADSVAEDTSDSDDTSDGDSASASGELTLDPCDLLTLDDVTGAGIAVVDGPIEDPSTVEGFATCYFADERESAGVRVSVTAPDDSLAGGVSDEEEIDGLGASATYSESARLVRVVLDDGTIVTVEIAFFLDPEDPRDVLIELAELAIA